MNASQRRISRRSILTAFKLNASVETPTGAVAKITNVMPNNRLVVVKYKNNRTATLSLKEVKILH